LTRVPSPNRATLESVASHLEPLLQELVFVGGQVAELLITDPAAIRVRPTTDVDVIVVTASKVEYRMMEKRLSDLGLKQDMSEDAPICRWLTVDHRKVDVMPIDQSVLGFANQWYAAAVERAIDYVLTDQIVIRIPTAPVFLATKWEAYQGRGQGDMLGSHDLEDVITVIAGRPGIVEELAEEPEDLRRWLSARAVEFLDDPASSYALQGALPDVAEAPDLMGVIQERIASIGSVG
jgi:predicted nucleotidyltransferase